MSSESSEKNVIQQPLPAWLGAGVVGLVLGVGVTAVAMHGYGYRMTKPDSSSTAESGPGGMSSGMAGSGMMGMGGGPAGGSMMAMGGGGMGSGMGGGGMSGGAGAGAGRAKRSLTSLVGRLELLTRGNLTIELDAEQKSKIAAKLATLDQAENMTGEEAEAHVAELEATLTADQKAVLDSVGLPFGRAGGGGGAPGGRGAQGMGGPGGGGPNAMMTGGGGAAGGPAPPEDENPFQQETNQKRLKDLLDRLGSTGDSVSK